MPTLRLNDKRYSTSKDLLIHIQRKVDPNIGPANTLIVTGTLGVGYNSWFIWALNEWLKNHSHISQLDLRNLQNRKTVYDTRDNHRHSYFQYVPTIESIQQLSSHITNIQFYTSTKTPESNESANLLANAILQHNDDKEIQQRLIEAYEALRTNPNEACCYYSKALSQSPQDEVIWNQWKSFSKQESQSSRLLSTVGMISGFFWFAIFPCLIIPVLWLWAVATPSLTIVALSIAVAITAIELTVTAILLIKNGSIVKRIQADFETFKTDHPLHAQITTMLGDTAPIQAPENTAHTVTLGSDASSATNTSRFWKDSDKQSTSNETPEQITAMNP